MKKFYIVLWLICFISGVIALILKDLCSVNHMMLLALIISCKIDQEITNKEIRQLRTRLELLDLYRILEKYSKK